MLDPLNLEFQVIGSYSLWVLGTKLVYSEDLKNVLSQ